MNIETILKRIDKNRQQKHKLIEQSMALGKKAKQYCPYKIGDTIEVIGQYKGYVMVITNIGGLYVNNIEEKYRWNFRGDIMDISRTKIIYKGYWYHIEIDRK